MTNIICGAQMVEEMSSLQISHIKLKETFERHEKLLSEILWRLESLRTAENSIWKISQVDHPAVEREIQIGQPNLTSLVEFSPTHHCYIDHPDHSPNEDLRMEDGFLSLVEVVKAAANKRKMDDAAAVGQIVGSYTAVVRGSKSLPWQQRPMLPKPPQRDCQILSPTHEANPKFVSIPYREGDDEVLLPASLWPTLFIKPYIYPFFYLGGEWECPEWNFFNYGRNVVCLRCDCKRPGETPFWCFWPRLWFGHGQTLMVPTPTSLTSRVGWLLMIRRQSGGWTCVYCIRVGWRALDMLLL